MKQRLKIIYLSILSLFIGLRVTLKNMFKPAVTLEYPKKKRTMTERFRGMVDLKPPDCVICYQCIKICPTAALFLSHQSDDTPQKKKSITAFTFNAELCCFCGLCEEICPTDAIYLNNRYEVTAFNHDELRIDLMNDQKYQHLEDNKPLSDQDKKDKRKEKA